MDRSALNVPLAGVAQLRWPWAEMLQRNDRGAKHSWIRTEFGPVIPVWGSTWLSYAALHAKLNVVRDQGQDQGRGQAKAECSGKGKKSIRILDGELRLLHLPVGQECWAEKILLLWEAAPLLIATSQPLLQQHQ